MKQGLQLGQTAEVDFVVTPEMFAQFNGVVVHELLSTTTLVHQMEWAARQTILPYLDSDEEGIGAAIKMHHLMPTPVGTKVTVKATVVGLQPRKVECELEARTSQGKIGRGNVVQAIITKGEQQLPTSE